MDNQLSKSENTENCSDVSGAVSRCNLVGVGLASLMALAMSQIKETNAEVQAFLERKCSILDIFGILEWCEESKRFVEGEDSPKNLLSLAEQQFYAEQMRAFTSFSLNSDAMFGANDPRIGFNEQVKLKQSVVVLFGLGTAGIGLARSLSLAGVGQIVGAFTEPPERTYEDACAIKAEIEHLNPCSRFTALQTPEEIPANLENISANLLVYCPESFQITFAQWLNRLSLDTFIPMIVYRQAGINIEMGPLIFPRETACFSCYQLRLQGIKGVGLNSSVGLNFSLGTDWLALEIVRFLLGLEIWTRERMWQWNIATGILEAHSVLRLPRCPVCGHHKLQPAKRLWEEI